MIKKCAYFKGFTLAEVMIVLTVIGVLTAILLPVARQSMPDENLMKFKKAHNTLGTVIRELVTSDKYYCNGDLGLKPDCTTLVTSGVKTIQYFCKTIADVINAKSVNCYNSRIGDVTIGILLSDEHINYIVTGEKLTREVNNDTINSVKHKLDAFCKNNTPDIGTEITLNDGVEFFQNGTIIQFGSHSASAQDYNNLTQTVDLRYFTPLNEFPANYSDQNGFDISYKIYCIDVDGIHPNATTSDCVNECPFGYGIRNDGKILTGARADEWLERDVNEE